jgi:hypothetical protein
VPSSAIEVIPASVDEGAHSAARYCHHQHEDREVGEYDCRVVVKGRWRQDNNDHEEDGHQEPEYGCLPGAKWQCPHRQEHGHRLYAEARRVMLAMGQPIQGQEIGDNEKVDSQKQPAKSCAKAGI